MASSPSIELGIISAPEEDSPPPSSQDVGVEEVLPGHSVSVFTYNDRKFFLGVQLAELLNRETFNLYRSMKIKRVIVSRASRAQIAFLQKVGAVRAGTHSVTLLDYDTSLAFLRETFKKRRSEPDSTRPSRRLAVEDDDPAPIETRARRISLGDAFSFASSPPALRAHLPPNAPYSAPDSNPQREPLPRHQQSSLGTTIDEHPEPLRDGFDSASPLPTGRWYHHPQASVPMPPAAFPGMYSQATIQVEDRDLAAEQHARQQEFLRMHMHMQMQGWLEGAAVTPFVEGGTTAGDDGLQELWTPGEQPHSSNEL